MKRLIPAYILAFVSGFMLLVYEPLNLYATNINDFWFDIYIMLKPTLIFFLAYFIVVSIFYTIVYLINDYCSKKLHVYKILMMIGIIIFISLYIQGNFMIRNLPALDGTKINWNVYKTEGIVSILVIFITTIIVIVTVYKFSYNKMIKIFSFVMIAIMLMLMTALISLIIKPGVLEMRENIAVATTKNIHQASIDKNFFILVVDAVDSIMFENVLKNSEYKDTFKDFTYFPDTMSTYAFTRESIPFILSGIWNNNEDEFIKYSKNAMNNSKFIDNLNEREYNINIYTESLIWNDEKAKCISNYQELDRELDRAVYLRELTKYVLFKYLPYPIKYISNIETINFDACKVKDKIDYYAYNNIIFYNYLKEYEIEKIDKKDFKFIHIEGGHVPFNYDKDVNIIKDGTYDQKLAATLTIINSYINRLKNNNVYDNSVIIVMSDHGYNFDNYIGRQNPILFIKGIEEEHDAMLKSDIPISFDDLNEAYIKLLDGAKSDEIFNNIDKNRKRRYLLYKYKYEDCMVEYEQTGKAWDETTLIPTGKEFNR